MPNNWGVGGGAHDVGDVEEDGDGFVLTCTCGWRSARHPSAEAVGHEWDRHRNAAT